MKKVVIACGAGLATSSMVRSKVEELLKENKVKSTIVQCTLSELDGHDGDSDVFITTMKVPQSRYNTPVVLGSAYLTGINEEKVNDTILEILKGGE